MIDRALNIEHRVGSKWVRITWLQDNSEPEIRWRLEQNGTPGDSIVVDVRAGSRRVKVSWPAGKYEPKAEAYDYATQEMHARSFVTNRWFADTDIDNDSGIASAGAGTGEGEDRNEPGTT